MRNLLLFSLITACAGTTLVSAQTYPVRPIRVIVPGSAGSANDFTARAIAQRLTDAWGQQIVIDNRSGAGGILAHELAAKATSDGYTLIFSTSAGLIINPLLRKVPYDSFRDLTPISLGSINPQMLFSNPSLPAASVEELIALARARPGQLNCASAGTGTPNHLGCELLKSMAKIDFVHVPYKGATYGITDVVAGQRSSCSTASLRSCRSRGREKSERSELDQRNALWPRPKCRRLPRPYRVSNASTGTRCSRPRKRRPPSWRSSMPRS